MCGVRGVLPDRREEDEKRDANRRAFDEMVERARQQPPEPHDPMRFRAVPPGRAEGHWPSCMLFVAGHARAGRRRVGQLAVVPDAPAIGASIVWGVSAIETDTCRAAGESDSDEEGLPAGYREHSRAAKAARRAAARAAAGGASSSSIGEVAAPAAAAGEAAAGEAPGPPGAEPERESGAAADVGNGVADTAEGEAADTVDGTTAAAASGRGPEVAEDAQPGDVGARGPLVVPVLQEQEQEQQQPPDGPQSSGVRAGAGVGGMAEGMPGEQPVSNLAASPRFTQEAGILPALARVDFR